MAELFALKPGSPVRLTPIQLLSISGVLLVTTFVDTLRQQWLHCSQVGPQAEALQMFGLALASPSATTTTVATTSSGHAAVSVSIYNHMVIV